MNLQTECVAVQQGLSFLTNQECFIGFVQCFFFPKWQFRYDRWLDYYIFKKTITEEVNVWRAIVCINCMRILKWFLSMFNCYLVLSTHNSNLIQQSIGYWNIAVSFVRHSSPFYFMIINYFEALLYILSSSVVLLLNLDYIYEISASSVSMGLSQMVRFTCSYAVFTCLLCFCIPVHCYWYFGIFLIFSPVIQTSPLSQR